MHQKFHYVLFEMTAHRIGETKVNTKLLRNAIVLFCSYVLGQYQAGYNYKKVRRFIIL